MTEEEARQKWCPMVRVSATDQVATPNDITVNRWKDGPGLLCVASDCMMARWVDDYTRNCGAGRVVVCDTEDADLTKGIWWDGKYAKNDDGRLHRQIAVRAFGPIPDGFYVDHIDGNRLNNRRGNLRLVTPQQSGANQKSRGGKSQYRGVSQQKNGRWAAQISKAGIRWCIGTYDTEEEAAKAYDDAAMQVHGEYARLNLEPIENSGRKFYCGLAGKP